MKKILLIGTGGTIASQVTEDGLAPELTSAQLLAHIPAISNICHVESLQLLNLDSTNIAPPHWLRMVRCIRDHYLSYDGFVLTHGTDTMSSVKSITLEITASTSPAFSLARHSLYSLQITSWSSLIPRLGRQAAMFALASSLPETAIFRL